jgi:hypothetical protein
MHSDLFILNNILTFKRKFLYLSHQPPERVQIPTQSVKRHAHELQRYKC